MANYIDVVKKVMRAHPEIDCTTPERGKIVDYVCQYLNPEKATQPFGRKSRNSQGTDLNEDGLTEMLPDGKFFIYDIILGRDPNPEDKDLGKFATWDTHGPFEMGENGYWVASPIYRDVVIVPRPTDDVMVLIEELKGIIREVQQENAFIKQELVECLRYGSFISLQTSSGFYFCAEFNGQEEDKIMSVIQYKGNVNASRRGIGPWETFKLVKP